jgi:hypothetical protein
MSAPIQARVHAPTAPLWQRVTAYSIGWAFILAGLVALNSFPIANALLGLGAWIVVIAPFFMRHRNAKSALIYVSPGQIKIRAPRSFPRTIMTRSLRGAALVRAENKFALWLAENSSPNTPITVEADERGIKEIRKALGIRRNGFGTIRKWPHDSHLRQAEIVTRAMIGALLAFGMIAGPTYAEIGLAFLFVPFLIAWLIVSAVFFMKQAPLVELEPETANDSNHDKAHIDHLKRGDASALDWLARVDALAATQNEIGYRGAQIPPDELWSAVENHETAHDVRAAAARVLLRVSPEKSADRIAAALDSIHDDTERAHLRAALDSDPEAAALELESLDRTIASRRA